MKPSVGITVSVVGILWSFGFILPEAIQAVFFGSTFQRMDSFLVGGTVFTITSLAAVVWLWLKQSDQFSLARKNSRDLVGANITNAVAWSLYILSIQWIEPAIAFTIFSGMIRLTTHYMEKSNRSYSVKSKDYLDTLGNILLVLGLIWLAIVTIGGWSGFTRGGVGNSTLGIILAMASGSMFSVMVIYCRQLDMAELGPVAQIGFRFPLHILLCVVGFLLGIDIKDEVSASDFMWVLLIAIPLMAFPIFSIQKAIMTASTSTIGAVSATGPVLVFLLQLIEGRVNYAFLTLAGPLIYSSGALLSLWTQMTRPLELPLDL